MKLRTTSHAILIVTILLMGSVWAQRPPRDRPPTTTPAAETETETAGDSEADDGVDIMAEYTRMAESFALDEEQAREVFFYRCQHVRSQTVKRVLDAFLTPAGTVADSNEADVVIVKDVITNIETLKQIAAEVDQPVAQVLVEARVVEFTVDYEFEKEINVEFQRFRNLNQIPTLPTGYMDFVKRLSDSFVAPGANPLATRGSLSWSEYDVGKQNLVTVFIKFLESRGKARILSAPNLILRRGSEGSIVTGEDVPIQTQTVTSGSVSTSTEFRSVGIKLRVSPLMITEDRVRLEVNPEVSNVTRTDPSSGAPIIAVRSATTELEVGDGELVSIGGLLRNEERETVRRVPVLASIPLLGHLFRGTDTQSVQTQLVIFLSIRVLNDGLSSVGMVDPGAVPPAVQDHVRTMEGSMELPPVTFRGDLELLLDREPDATGDDEDGR